MDSRWGKGRIAALTPGKALQVVELPDVTAHCSYPFVVEAEGRRILVPEMAAAGPPRLFELDGTSVITSAPLAGLEDVRLLDPTFLRHDGRWWLFAGMPGSAADLLWLWFSEVLGGPYKPHPDNPVIMDAACGPPCGPDRGPAAGCTDRAGRPWEVRRRRHHLGDRYADEGALPRRSAVQRAAPRPPRPTHCDHGKGLDDRRLLRRSTGALRLVEPFEESHADVKIYGRRVPED